jgi:uncharacterized protein
MRKYWHTMNIFRYFHFVKPPLIFESHPGKISKIVITGGMDGDELSGIEAAKELIQFYKNHPPLVAITIIPILNQAGYKSQVSYNPIDGLFPKYIYPGLVVGSSTQRLMWWLHQTYISKAQLWIDLHSGDQQEDLMPFIWLSQALPSTLRLLAGSELPILSTIDASLQPPVYLTPKGIHYVLIEAGSRGKPEPPAVKLHMTEVKRCIQNFAQPHEQHQVTPTFTTISFQYATENQSFRGHYKPGEIIESGETVLWQHIPGSVNKRELLMALGK